MKLILHCSFLLFLLHICNTPDAYCQAKVTTSKPNGENEATKAYCQAISEYVKTVYGKSVTRPDTLFIGKNVDMLDIKLPGAIQGINTVLITSEDAEKKLSYRKSLVYMNIVGWLEHDKSEFLIVTFFEFMPQHHCSIHFKRNAASKEMELESLTFQYPYTKKKMQKK